MYDQIARNKRNSLLLFAVFFVFVALVGYVFDYFFIGAGYIGLVAATIFSAASGTAAYYTGDKLILAISGARRIKKDDNPQLYNIAEEISISAGLPLPQIYIIKDDDAPNAFATGRNPSHASIAVTTALLNRLNRSELQGVIAHEMGHIKNMDILFATLIGIMVGIVAMMCDFFLRYTRWGFAGSRRRSSNRSGGQAEIIMLLLALVFAILAPLFAKILQMAVSRQREFLADSTSALLTRYPEGLASALEKISKDPGVLEVSNRATQHLYIVNPISSVEELRTKRPRGKSLFDTHPPIEERVKRLRSM